MKYEEVLPYKDCKMPIGLTLRITSLSGEKDPSKFQGKEGIVLSIDDYGQLHGTWNGLAVIPEVDKFILIDKKKDIVYISEHFND